MDILGLPLYPEKAPRFNIPPNSFVDVIYLDQVVPMEWGIEFGKFKHPNTRSETLKQKPYLQKMLLHDRCVVPANAFYEWPDKNYRPEFQNHKTRYYIHTPEKVIFLAGISRISDVGVQQFNILTTKANAEIDRFHGRMPVILPPDRVTQWLKQQKLDELYRVMSPYSGPLMIDECNAYVDNWRNEGPKCIEPPDQVQRKLL
jgi:putative SOS response-associated peptidase YedK